jgi:cell division protein FtsB
MFRFTIRDVLWLTVVAAVLASWWAGHRRDIAKVDLANEQREKANAQNQRLVAENQRLQADVSLFAEKEVLKEAFVQSQRDRVDELNREAVAKLKARGFKFPRGFKETQEQDGR